MVAIRQKTHDTCFLTGLALVFLLAFSFSCSHTKPRAIPGYPPPYKVLGRWYQPLPNAEGFKQRGTASWYGPDFHGKKTANGETYNMHAMTAAHKTLPLGTKVRVRNLSNNREIIVRINDRGPFAKGRIIDLSYTAAKKLDLVHHGTGRVEVRALSEPVSTPQPAASLSETSASYTLQVGSFGKKTNAENLVQTLSRHYSPVSLVPEKGHFKVRVGRFASRDEAEMTRAELAEQGYSAFPVPLK